MPKLNSISKIKQARDSIKKVHSTAQKLAQEMIPEENKVPTPDELKDVAENIVEMTENLVEGLDEVVDAVGGEETVDEDRGEVEEEREDEELVGRNKNKLAQKNPDDIKNKDEDMEELRAKLAKADEDIDELKKERDATKKASLGEKYGNLFAPHMKNAKTKSFLAGNRPLEELTTIFNATKEALTTVQNPSGRTIQIFQEGKQKNASMGYGNSLALEDI